MSTNAIPELNSAIITEMYRCAVSRYPEEACGFLVQTSDKKYQFMEARNVAENPVEQFVMHKDDVISSEDAGDVVAIWHSHTDRSNAASDSDMAGCESTDVPWLILALCKNLDDDVDADFRFSEMNVITPSGFEMPYVGRPYVFGVFDCWMLCRDYLKREFDVDINANMHLHVPRWYEGSENILDDNYEHENLVRLAPGQEPQRGDIFFLQYGRMPDHCMVYEGDDRVLHHQVDRLSSRGIYGGAYKKHTTHHLRHKELLQGNEKCLN